MRASVVSQTMWYMTFGVWLLILNALAGGPIPNIGISLIFSHESISVSAQQTTPLRQLERDRRQQELGKQAWWADVTIAAGGEGSTWATSSRSRWGDYCCVAIGTWLMAEAVEQQVYRD
eukprot:6212398-Pleurochrysis_carterae.AAC.4